MINANIIHRRQLANIITTINRYFGRKSTFSLEDLSLALFYHHLFYLEENVIYKGKRDQILEQIVRKIKVEGLAGIMGTPQGPFLMNCLANVIKGMYRNEENSPALYDSVNQFSHELLNEGWITKEWSNWGYLDGWAGMANYYLELPKEFSSRAAFLKRLDQVPDEWILTSFGQYPGLPFRQRPLVEVGLGSGITGILTVLERLATATGNPLLATLLEENVRQLLQWRQEVDQTASKCSFFPFMIDRTKREAHYDNRLWWKSGDLGQVLLLYRNGQLQHNDHQARTALLVALNTLMRKVPQHTNIENATIEEGAAGVAELYRKLFHLMGNTQLLDGYHYWISETERLLEKEVSEGRWYSRGVGVLDGLTGIGLTLAFSEYGMTTSWSDVLLI
ncbi:hypothetical protein KTO58_25930 [Chitinophaga pendula]|uniref:lanthionine synthetase LanC family protein n=1 Tax=Chitinophaga TaxID=79328 RepID=UPI000BAFEFEA|nr:MULTISPECIES: lanthionine synthetase LanC family protein [Chitinophaga]ASZ09987.1 hypothetical protein CK934_02840 [Chitinophaga sp. MD30]UCJ07067.1 hypothetical protein KTO58_25930 [Chitinophaga pendula]